MAEITVLMPVYNAASFLKEAIESILNQSFTDFEFLIIDDGSKDQSVEIVKSFYDSRIRFIQNDQNLGISATLNKGIVLASSPLIARMDADDVSHSERLKRQYEYMASNEDCAMVSSLVRVIDEDGKLIRQDSFKSEFFYYNLTFICWIYHPTVMYRKKQVQDVGMYTVAYSEDFELFWRLSRKYKFYNLPEVLLDYRVTSQSLHQVLKKSEYAKAQQQQLLRNFRFYTSPDFNIEEDYIECLQHNFVPLLKRKNIGDIISCVRQLDQISKGILATENINRDQAAIKLAAQFKREYILSFFVENLPFVKSFLLMVMSKYYKVLIRTYQKRFLRKINSVKNLVLF